MVGQKITSCLQLSVLEDLWCFLAASLKKSSNWVVAASSCKKMTQNMSKFTQKWFKDHRTKLLTWPFRPLDLHTPTLFPFSAKISLRNRRTESESAENKRSCNRRHNKYQENEIRFGYWCFCASMRLFVFCSNMFSDTEKWSQFDWKLNKWRLYNTVVLWGSGPRRGAKKWC